MEPIKFPEHIIGLAQRANKEEGICLILADALEEIGMPIWASHFRAKTDGELIHPDKNRNCHWVDCILLGKLGENNAIMQSEIAEFVAYAEKYNV